MDGCLSKVKMRAEFPISFCRLETVEDRSFFFASPDDGPNTPDQGTLTTAGRVQGFGEDSLAPFQGESPEFALNHAAICGHVENYDAYTPRLLEPPP